MKKVPVLPASFRFIRFVRFPPAFVSLRKYVLLGISVDVSLNSSGRIKICHIFRPWQWRHDTHAGPVKACRWVCLEINRKIFADDFLIFFWHLRTPPPWPHETFASEDKNAGGQIAASREIFGLEHASEAFVERVSHNPRSKVARFEFLGSDPGADPCSVQGDGSFLS